MFTAYNLSYLVIYIVLQISTFNVKYQAVTQMINHGVFYWYKLQRKYPGLIHFTQAA